MLQPVPATTDDELVVQNENPVVLDGYIDGSGNLQIAHGSDDLIDYEDHLVAKHSTHETITIRIYDFSSGGVTWQIDASHPGVTAPIDWSRGTNYAYYTFGATNGFIQVDIEATSSTAGEAKGRLPRRQAERLPLISQRAFPTDFRSLGEPQGSKPHRAPVRAHSC